MTQTTDPPTPHAGPGAGAPDGAEEAELLAQARLSPEALLERRRNAEAVYVFDLRDQDAFSDRHFPGAFSLPWEQLESNVHRLPFSGLLLFYDEGEGLVQQAGQVLVDNGFTDFHFVAEGLDALMTALEQSPHEIHFQSLGPAEQAAAVEKVLDEKVREFLARDGGGLEVVSIEPERLLVSYQGACGGCSSSTAGTLRFIQTIITNALNHEIEVVPVDA